MVDIQALLQDLGEWLIKSGPRILLVFILMLVGMKGARLVAERLFYRRKKKDDEEYKKRSETLSAVVRQLLSSTVILIAIVMILDEVGVKVGPVLAAAGVLGVAIGFGAQHLVRDVISGFFILLEDQIRVGDVVQIAGKGGLVERITLRMTILRDLAGNVHYVRNGEIDVVTNMTKDYSRYVFDIGVAYREDVDEVIEVVKQVDNELRADPTFASDILEPIEILGLDQFGDSAIVIKARTKTKPIKQWAVGREFNRRLKKRFDEKDIEIPFPHVTLYMGQDKGGQAAPMNVALQQS
jgi:small conductance mechanosensitive channel